MTTQARIDALNAAGEALASLGEARVTIVYDATNHPGNRFGAMVHGLSGAAYTGHGDTPAKAYENAKAKRSLAAGSVAA